MDFEDILKARDNRNSRIGAPIKTLFEYFTECEKCIEFLKTTEDMSINKFLLRSLVISTVTSIEVYYKDMLDYVFRVCDPVFFKPLLKDLHKTKYDIDELVSMYEKQIHPCELIALNQSFQNIETIDAVFKKILGSSLYEKVFNLQIRIKNDPSTETRFDKELLKSLEELFTLRHELVHNPNNKLDVSLDKVEKLITNSCFFVLGTDIVLTNFYEEHKNINFKNNLGK